MHLVIDLPSTACKAGSTVSGVVALRGDQDVDVRSIAISLIGRVKTKVTKKKSSSTSIYRGRAPLLFERRLLFAGPNTLHPGHRWPFEFTLPPYCVARGQDTFNRDEGPLTGGRTFNLEPNQSLPPTFADSDEQFMMGIDCECFVSYELQAKLIIERRALGPKEIDTVTRLNLVTARSIQNPHTEMASLSRWFGCSSLALNPGHGNVPLSFKEKMKSLRTSKLPFCRFSLGLRYPQAAVPNQTFPLSLSIGHDLERSTTTEPPLIFLRKCSVHLVATTDIQCMRTHMVGPDGEQQSWDRSFDLDSCDFSKEKDQAPIISEHMNLGEMMKLRMPRGHAPTFSTFNIRRTYRLNIKATIECAQQPFKADFTTEHLVLFAAAYEPGLERENDAVSPVRARREDESDDVAPAYAAGTGVHLPNYADVKNSGNSEHPGPSENPDYAGQSQISRRYFSDLDGVAD